jgi:hypothetical protein
MRLHHLRQSRTGHAAISGAILSLGMLASAACAASGEPLGNEIQVNSYTPGDQTSLDIAAGAADGRFTAVWISPGNISPSMQDYNVYGQRFSEAGARVGSEFVVNALATGRERAPQIAMDAAGSFTVVWLRLSDADSGYYSSVYMRRFAADGTPLSGDIAVSDVSAPNIDELSPRVEMRADGSSVITWATRVRTVEPGRNYEVSEGARYARIFDASGTPQSASIEVAAPISDRTLSIPLDYFEYGPYLNLYFIAASQASTPLALTSDGGFVVGWSKASSLAAQLGFYDLSLPPLTLGLSSVYAQRYDAAGIARGSRILVDLELTRAGIDSNPPAIAALPDGGFIIGYALANAWGLGDSQRGWYARRYNNQGGRVGLRISMDRDAGLSSPYQGASPALASSGAGNFVMAWANGSNGDIAARTYGADGRPLSDTFIVNQLTLGAQDSPSLAVQPGGSFVAGWQTLNVDGSSYSVAARRFDGP